MVQMQFHTELLQVYAVNAELVNDANYYCFQTELEEGKIIRNAVV